MAKRGRPRSGGKRYANGRRKPNQEGAPTCERLTHGVVEHPVRPIADDEGRPSRPYRAVTLLMSMERRDSITPGMRQAGEDFQTRFFTAQLDPIHASKLLRMGPSTAGDEPSLRTEGARYSVWRAICAVGGLASPAGSCVWNVLGCDQSLQKWALDQGLRGHGYGMGMATATSVLIAALGALEDHYR